MSIPPLRGHLCWGVRIGVQWLNSCLYLDSLVVDELPRVDHHLNSGNLSLAPFECHSITLQLFENLWRTSCWRQLGPLPSKIGWIVPLVLPEHFWWNSFLVESGVRKSATGGYTRSLISSALSNSLSLSFFGLSGHGWGSFLLWNPLVKRAGSRHRNGFKRLSWAAVASCRNGSFRWLDSCRGMWQVAGLCLLLCLFFFSLPSTPPFLLSLFPLSKNEWGI